MSDQEGSLKAGHPAAVKAGGMRIVQHNKPGHTTERPAKDAEDCTGLTVVMDNFHPTEISQSDMRWLYARNHKYAVEALSPSKIGKWMLFLSSDIVNEVWDKIKMAVASGDLWHAKVSTNSPRQSSYAVMIYTKDYTDLEDVINVLNYLESSGIKSPHVTIRYKTDEQTRAGIYSGGKQRPWIYSSDTIRGATVTDDQSSHSLSWRSTQIPNPSSSSASAPLGPSYQT